MQLQNLQTHSGNLSFLYMYIVRIKINLFILLQPPHVGRVAQRKKKFNQFYCLIMILGYKRNSKLLFMKKNLEPSWRYHLTHTANSAQIWQNFIAVYHQPSNMAQDFISLLPILSSFFIPKS